MEELTPQNAAERMMGLGETCDAIGVVAAVHPLVTQAISTLQQRGVPVFALISQLAATVLDSKVESGSSNMNSWACSRSRPCSAQHYRKQSQGSGAKVFGRRPRVREIGYAPVAAKRPPAIAGPWPGAPS